MMKFFCPECKIDFETAQPVKKQYNDYLLGQCSRNIAYCPKCSRESAEKIIPKPQKLAQRAPQNYCNGNCSHCPEA
jgi:hypothetical protein